LKNQSSELSQRLFAGPDKLDKYQISYFLRFLAENNLFGTKWLPIFLLSFMSTWYYALLKKSWLETEVNQIFILTA